MRSSRSSKSSACAAFEGLPVALGDAGEAPSAANGIAVLASWPSRAVLAGGDAGQDPPGRVHLLREVERAQGFAHRRHLVVLVVDHEVGGEPGRRGVAPQHAHAEAVERGDPAPERAPLSRASGARLHLARRLVGEGDGQDLLGRDALVEHEVGDAVGDDAGLAAARPGEDQDRPVGGEDGLPLLRIEPVEDGGRGPPNDQVYSTVTDLARFRGWSTSRPARTAT